jgi:L-rhamnose mutarotase
MVQQHAMTADDADVKRHREACPVDGRLGHRDRAIACYERRTHAREESGMQRVCFLLKVRADRIDEYRERHKEVWPELCQELSATGWHNYSLFLREDGLLIGYLETEDFEKARAGMATSAVNARWQAQMAPLFEALDGAAPDEAMRPLTEIFHLP